MFRSTEVSMVRHCASDEGGSLHQSHLNVRKTPVESNMTAVVETQSPARSVEFLLPTNISDHSHANSTQFQDDLRPWSSTRAERVREPTPAQVDHEDLRHIKEYVTEAMASYQCHPLPQMTRSPQMTSLPTNFEMQTDPEGVAFLTTYSQKFQAWPFQVPPTPIRPTQAVKNNPLVEKLPESTNRSTFLPHHSPSIVKATAKHLDGFPTIKGDECHRSFVSHYNDTFQGAWSRAAQPVDQHCSSVIIGDPVKTVERATTHSASFSRPTACRPRVVKERLKLNLGNLSKNPWSSTSKETYCCHKLGSPVELKRGNKTSSSLPSGDTDTSRNRERLSLTTNRVSFSDPTPPQPPVYVQGSDLMTKSNVEFSPAPTSGLYYTTTAKHHFGRKEVEPVRPAIQFRSNILTGPETVPNLSTTQADFLPLRACKQKPCLLLQQSHIRFPLAEPHFSTTHSEDYTFKPRIVQQPGCSHFLSHIVMK